jgi:hypothetical protein
LLSLDSRRSLIFELLLSLLGDRDRLAADSVVDLLGEPRVRGFVVLEELLKLLYLLCARIVH